MARQIGGKEKCQEEQRSQSRCLDSLPKEKHRLAGGESGKHGGQKRRGGKSHI